MLKIYHNPRCSKSRAALNYLEEQGLDFTVRLYLEDQFSTAELNALLKKLAITARELLRTGEADYKDNNLKDPKLNEAELVEFMVKYPKLIERPIIEDKQAAIVARPLDKLIDFLADE